mmetsp:Transcript_604/g.1224  ORF Transcript_604/g.1224 Transcript_604/m.1224 type:complete len:236 (-) Transcript_604:531-1238(-)
MHWPLPRWSDYRNDGLRGGGLPRHHRRRERRARMRRAATPHHRQARGLRRRADRRLGDARHAGAVPHVHVARRVASAAARRQRRPASHSQGRRRRMCQRRAAPTAEGQGVCHRSRPARARLLHTAQQRMGGARLRRQTEWRDAICRADTQCSQSDSPRDRGYHCEQSSWVEERSRASCRPSSACPRPRGRRGGDQIFQLSRTAGERGCQASGSYVRCHPVQGRVRRAALPFERGG